MEEGRILKRVERFKNLLEQLNDVLEGLKITDKVRIDERLLELSVIDYFEDIERLKDFHEIERVNVKKIYSYGAYWFLRRKPIQITDPSVEKNLLHINEKVCTAITIPKMLKEMNILATDDNKRILDFIDLLYYNFKYRTYTQQSLELVMEAFFCGCSCFSTESGDNDEKDDAGRNRE